MRRLDDVPLLLEGRMQSFGHTAAFVHDECFHAAERREHGFEFDKNGRRAEERRRAARRGCEGVTRTAPSPRNSLQINGFHLHFGHTPAASRLLTEGTQRVGGDIRTSGGGNEASSRLMTSTDERNTRCPP
ncbi:hypothetical protein GCM10009763_20920 [Dermacoccus profundi]|uniref:Uncharacterized protein n=2 Tax=Dermacoccus TaxID=57495 RepID=A0ABN2B0Z6_9MICO